MPRQTISEAIDARIFALKAANEARDLQLVIEDLESGGFTGSITTSYVLENPQGLDIAISVKKSLKPEHAKSFALLVEVNEEREPDYRFQFFPVCQRNELLCYIITEIGCARFL